nr:hypothetical protein [Tanacetum cinerariifolium]
GKPRPAKKTKSDATASTGGSNASTQFGKVMEHELRMKREAAERAFEAQVKKDRTPTRLEELRFLATSTKDLDDDYFDVIITPLDFGTICNNLENGLMYKNSKNVYKDVEYIWGIATNHVIEQDEDQQPTIISNGPPLSAFFSHLPEMLTKIKSFHQKEGPLFGYGFQECGLKASWMMPVWDPLRSSSYSDCTGIVGIVTGNASLPATRTQTRYDRDLGR